MPPNLPGFSGVGCLRSSRHVERPCSITHPSPRPAPSCSRLSQEPRSYNHDFRRGAEGFPGMPLSLAVSGVFSDALALGLSLARCSLSCGYREAGGALVCPAVSVCRALSCWVQGCLLRTALCSARFLAPWPPPAACHQHPLQIVTHGDVCRRCQCPFGLWGGTAPG